MIKFLRSFYGKISVAYLVLLLILGAILITFSINSSMKFVQESDQRLNRNLASDLLGEFKTFLTDSLDQKGIGEMFKHLMVMNPRVEIYLIDKKGTILAFFAEPEKVKLESVSLDPVNRFFLEEKLPIYGDDPRSLDRKKTFSVAPVKIGPDTDGYLYVILGGEDFDAASALAENAYITNTTVLGIILIILFTALIGLLLFFFLTKKLQTMTSAVKRFEKGNFAQRVNVHAEDEIGQLARSFNSMADTIVSNMDALKQTDRLRRELIANVSHDLRSPLASIQGYIETILVKNTTLNAEEREKYLKIIFDDTQMLNRLIDELFELSKLDAKQIQPEPEPFAIAELVQDIVMKLKPEAEKHKVNLQASLPEDLPMVYGDIGMIERAMANIIDNALRYTPSGGEVTVNLQNVKDFVRIVVKDTGHGIPEDEIPLVFERFYRVEKSRKKSAGGTGLGLAISKKIIDLHNSTISVESKLDVGTTMSFDLMTRSSNLAI